MFVDSFVLNSRNRKTYLNRFWKQRRSWELNQESENINKFTYDNKTFPSFSADMNRAKNIKTSTKVWLKNNRKYFKETNIVLLVIGVHLVGVWVTSSFNMKNGFTYYYLLCLIYSVLQITSADS